MGLISIYLYDKGEGGPGYFLGGIKFSLTMFLFENVSVMVFAGAIPDRSGTYGGGKWKTDRDEYAYELYPNYCAGMAYMVKTRCQAA